MDKKQYLSDIFTELQKQNINYMVLRKFEDIPYKITLENDLDLLCQRDERNQIKKFFKNKGFMFYMDSLIDNSYLYGSYPHDHFINEAKDIHIDIVYSLAYKSTNRREWIPAHVSMQKTIWENKEFNPNSIWGYQPSSIDELIHILCHCIFDKRETDDYYRKQIAHLIKLVNKKELTELLNHVFFKFTPHLIDYLERNKIDNLFEQYISFKEY